MSKLLCGWDDGNPYGEPSAILHRFGTWAACMIGHVGRLERFGPCTVIAVAPDGSLDCTPLAVVVYNNHDEYSRTIEISCAASDARWATRGTLRACLSYPFIQLGCGVVICRTPQRARRTKRFLAGIGFKNCGTVPFGFGDDSASIYAMTRKDAGRWLTATLPQRKAA